MTWTGERMIPGASPPGVEARHRARYHFVIDQEGARNEAGLNILDAPCGEGYGSRMLKACGYVIGLDVDAPTIDHARKTYRGTGGPFFYCADIPAWQNPGCIGFDVVVCLEGIEHVSREAGPAWIEAFAREAVCPGARLYISSPNPQTSRSNSRYHIHEYRPGALLDLVETGGLWRVRGVYGQWRAWTPEVVPIVSRIGAADWTILRAFRTEVGI